MRRILFKLADDNNVVEQRFRSPAQGTNPLAGHPGTLPALSPAYPPLTVPTVTMMLTAKSTEYATSSHASRLILTTGRRRTVPTAARSRAGAKASASAAARR